MARAVSSIVKEENHFAIKYGDETRAKLFIVNDHVFRYHWDPTNIFLDDPVPLEVDHVAKITIKSPAQYDNEEFMRCESKEEAHHFYVETSRIIIDFDKFNSLFSVTDKRANKKIVKQVEPVVCVDGVSKLILSQDRDEFFYGCGTQNGRFSHKGEIVGVVNTNDWVDGGVASPCPFYWSTAGYGVLRHTWSPGNYDFGFENSDRVVTEHRDKDLDAFFFIDDSFVGILRDYYEITGNPVLLPEYALYEAHFNAYNRDYWVPVTDPQPAQKAVLFEDGKYYCEYQPKDLKGREGILESLNGEKDNYLFSARAVIDRYERMDVPLGWFIPNDGYGAGYGQTESLDGDIDNLKTFVEYCERKNVKVGLWTESNLHPKHPSRPEKGDRDIEKEVGIAGIVALKTDMAWVGDGYSFGLNGIEDAAKVMVGRTGGLIRPMILTVDGWAGTQRHAAVWSGDQIGGQWENIRFHIPTLVGTSLSGQPNVGSDTDGIFGGKNRKVNVRDFQWKAFTPVQTNMDGWGAEPKTPFQFDREATDINRAYLKLKSMLMPYNYSIAYRATRGPPMMRAMFLEFPGEKCAYTKDSQYQYMWGPFFLVAPVYSDSTDEDDASIRNGIYLPGPHQIWIDFFSGERHRGGIILNNVKVPLWKLPLYVKSGAIIPVTNPNNNPKGIDRTTRTFIIYPEVDSDFELYEDDGLSTAYLHGHNAKTEINTSIKTSDGKSDLKISVSKTVGSYEGFVPFKRTVFHVMTSGLPESVTCNTSDDFIHLKKAETKEEFESWKYVFFLDENFTTNRYLCEAGTQTCLSIKLDVIDTASDHVDIFIKSLVNEYEFLETDKIAGDLKIPKNIRVSTEKVNPTSVKLEWSRVDNACRYDVKRDGALLTNIKESHVTFHDFLYSTEHEFNVRAVNESGVSEWSETISCSTPDNPYKNVIRGVKIHCNFPEQKCEELFNLSNNDNKIWHTHWDRGMADPKTGSFICLYFDLGCVYNLSKIEYLPRADAGNGTVLRVRYRTSADHRVWTDYSDDVLWNRDSSTKFISLDRDHVRFVEIKILDSVGNFGSGRKMLFFKKA